jgi:Fe-S-cluster containining protein
LSEPAITLIAASELLRTRADTRIEETIRGLPAGGTEITCRAGCSACCRQLVVVSPLEVAAIGEFVRARPDLAAEVEGRIEHWRAAVAADSELSALLQTFEAAEGYVEGEEGEALELSYWRRQLPCPFLAEDRCTIYPVRPFACREHHVTSDPRLCAEDLDRVTPAGTRLEFRAVGSQVGASCFDTPDRLIPLPLAWDYARNHPEDPTRPAPATRFATIFEAAQRQARRALALIMLAARR